MRKFLLSIVFLLLVSFSYSQLTITITSSGNPICFGDNTGFINTMTTGGTPPYTYNWNSGHTTDNISFLPAGFYEVTVTDNLLATHITSINLNEPTMITISGTTNDVLCNGGNDGSIDITVTGGNPPYNYNWSNSLVSEDITMLYPGSYTVTVTDMNGCTKTEFYNINSPAYLNFYSNSVNNTSCPGLCDGSVDMFTSGGTPPYSYLWSANTGSQTTEDLINLCAYQQYLVTVTDANGCTSEQNIWINEPMNISSYGNPYQVTCSGMNNGSIDLFVNGGITPYTYLWSNSQTTEDLSGLSGGNYFVTITDNNGCFRVDSFFVHEPSPLNLTLTKQDVTCFGGNDGFIDINVTGGSPSYNFNWSNGSYNEDLWNIMSNTYSVTVTDMYGCIKDTALIVYQIPEIMATPYSTNSTCGMNDGAAWVDNVSGGVTPYSFQWNFGPLTDSVANLYAGTYNLQIKDANNCKKDFTFNINDIGAPTISVNSYGDITCNGANNGYINMDVTGGTTPYTYNWSNGATTQNISGLAQNYYILTVTDALGCKASNYADIKEPEMLNAFLNTFPPTCPGNSNAGVNVNTYGGTQPYTYEWHICPNQTSYDDLCAGNFSFTTTDANLYSQPAGAYKLYLYDANGCSYIDTVVISEPDSIQISAVIHDVKCFNYNDGKVDLTITGGMPPYSFNWSNNTYSEDLDWVNVGTYSVTVTDMNSCTKLATYTINQPTQINISYTKNDITCFGGNNGSIDITVSGGISPYTFNWGPQGNTEDLINLYSGYYNINVYDANNCYAGLGVDIYQPAEMNLIMSSGNANCSSNDGNMSVTVNNGNPPFTYLWSNSATTDAVMNVSAGTYNVTVTDNTGCVKDNFVIVDNNSSLMIDSINVAHVLCYGGNNGTISAFVSGGAQPYSYIWSNSAITTSITNLNANNYFLTVTDNVGCQKIINQNINQPERLKLDIFKIKPYCTGQSSGQISVSVLGGISPYNYLWNNSSTNSNIYSIPSGTYSLTVTDYNGCTKDSSIVLIDHPDLVMDSVIVKDITCFNMMNGQIRIYLSGGVGQKQYSINGNWQPNNIFNNLGPGSYTLVVKDSTMCYDTLGIYTINNPTELISTINPTSVSCFGMTNGAADLTVTGGTTPYTYSWNSGTYTTEDLTNIPSGFYNVTITDANGCNRMDQVNIFEPGNISLTFNKYDVDCNGGNNGYINLFVNGGNPSYTFNWSNAATTQNLTNLVAGNYSVTVTDMNGCTANTNIVINEPTLLNVTTTITHLNCNNDSTGYVSANVTGGFSPYNYNWSNGITSFATGSVQAGTYNLTVTDNKGCFATTSAVVNQPPALNATISSTTNVTCWGWANGSTSVIAGGGTPPYSYLWQGGNTNANHINLTAGTYNVTVTDANGCVKTNTATITQPASWINLTQTTTDPTCNGGSNGSANITVTGGTPGYTYNWTNGATTEDLSGIPAGSYTVTVTDANACTNTISVSLNQPNAITTSISKTDISCFGGNNGTATVTASNGVSPYSYLWSNSMTTASITNLVAGNYFVTVTDNNSCTKVDSVNFVAPNPITVGFTLMDIMCNGASDGSINLNVTGGATPYSFLWSNSMTTQNISGLMAGAYGITVTDMLGCTGINTITLTEPTAISLTINTTDIQCLGSNNGSVDIIVTGGVSPYQYSLDGGIYQASNNFTGLSSGNHTIDVKDANNCIINDMFTISEPIALSAITSKTDETCTLNNGSATVSATGGVTPYTYNWSNSMTTQTITGLAAGTYDVTVTDNNGCTTTSSAIIIDLGGLTANITAQTNVICFGGATGSATVSATGGTSPYTYNWTGGQSTQTATALYAGIFDVTVTDNNACTSIATVTITEPAELTIGTSPADETCSMNNGSITNSVSGGVSPYTYNWSNALTTQNITGISAGTYDLTVTDNNGCTAYASATVNNISGPTATITSQTNVSCFGGANGTATVTANGGASPYTYNWQGGINTATASSLNAGSYDVTVTDINGCISIATATITEPSAIIMTTSPDTMLCAGGTAIISSNVTGGQSPYTYSWSNGNTNPSVSYVPSTSEILTLTVTDANACSVQNNVIITVNQLPTVSFTGLASEYCKANQLILLVGSHSVNGTFTGNGISNRNVFNPLNAQLGTNTITYTYTDQYGCTNSFNKNVTINDLPIVNPVTTNSDCGLNNGSVVINVTGGATPYTYSTGSSTVNNLLAGNYNVTVTDSKGCKKSKSYTILDNGAPAISVLTTTPASCEMSCDGSSTISISGGVSPYTILWSSSENTLTASQLCTGDQFVKVTAANGCITSEEVSIGYINPNPTIYGKVTYSGGNIDGQYAGLKIYSRTLSTGGGFDLLPSTYLIASDGTFILYNFPPDQYVLKVVLDSTYAANNGLKNSYFSADTVASTWSKADTIILNCGQDFIANIVMFEYPTYTAGNGLLSGNIYYPPQGGGAKNVKGVYTSYGKAAGEPVPGAEITLEQEPDDAPMSGTTTDANGGYDFTNMPNGVYSLRVEIPGFPMLSTYELTISDTTLTFNNLNFYVDTTAGDGNVDTVLVYDENLDIAVMSISIYPNPSTDIFNINYELNLDSKVKIEVVDINGRTIEKFVNESQLSGKYSYIFNSEKYNLMPGMYFVKVMTDNNIYVKRIVLID